jgi:hypothetical protein
MISQQTYAQIKAVSLQMNFLLTEVTLTDTKMAVLVPIPPLFIFILHRLMDTRWFIRDDRDTQIETCKVIHYKRVL